jgi:hypothetical protein
MLGAPEGPSSPSLDRGTHCRIASPSPLSCMMRTQLRQLVKHSGMVARCPVLRLVGCR